MTAINPAKLKIQAAELGEFLSEPELLIQRLHDLLGFYGARIRQTSLSKTHLTLQTYQCPAPVLRALEIEFKDRLAEDPQAGYQVTDALWGENWVEFHQLAVFTLSCLPLDTPEEVLRRVRDWLQHCTAEDIRRLVMTRGLGVLAEENPSRCLDFIQELIDTDITSNHQAALFGLSFFVTNPGFTNFPVLYKKLGQILRAEESGLVKEISDLLRQLMAHSEQETAYFLANQLKESSNPRISRVTRQLLGTFSEDNQQLLREGLGKNP